MHIIKNYLRNRLIACHSCYQRYVQLKYHIIRLFELSYCLHDLKNILQYMCWGNEAHMTTTQLQAKLLFYYHKIEKGLCMPGKKRLFAIDVIPKVINLLKTWEINGNSQGDTVYLGALSSLRSYNKLLECEMLDPEGKIIPLVRDFLAQRYTQKEEQATPITLSDELVAATINYEEFRTLCQIRRSFRSFSDQAISNEVIQRAVELAQLSPSACNRQPCKVYVVRENNLKQELLSHQNGNAGFGHLAPVVMVITADMSHFFGATERHQPHVDGGLFSMSLLYALQVQGLVSCCLNWCVKPVTDARVHRLLSIPDSERIVMFILAGYPLQQTVVPKSHRKLLESVLVYK